MADQPVSDERLAKVLGAYAGMVSRVLENPERWLGLDEDPPPSAGLPARALDAVRDRAFGEQTPASPTWPQVAVDKRVEWWLRRIGISAGLAAAAPRFFGAVADRLPVQASLGAAASGLAVCATAREHGRTEPADWVPLLARVLFDRALPAPPATPADDGEAERRLSDEEGSEPDRRVLATLGRGAARAALTLWKLAGTLWQLSSLLDERPRGGFVSRAVGKLPVVGVAGGWLDERGGIRKASRQTAALLG